MNMTLRNSLFLQECSQNPHHFQISILNDSGSLKSTKISLLPLSANFCDLFNLVRLMISYKSHFSNRGCQTLQVGYRVLGVQPNSPAAVGGLVSFFDFIVAAKGIPLATLDSTFVELIKVCAPYRVLVSMLSS